MVDYMPVQYYEPPAIILVVDEEEYPASTEFYPDTLHLTDLLRYDFGDNYEGYSIEENCRYRINITSYVYIFTDDEVSLPIYSVICLADEASDDEIGYRYYAVDLSHYNVPGLGSSASLTYLYQSDLPEGLTYDYNPAFHPEIGGEDIFWLYDFGHLLTGLGSVINGFLSFKVGDYNFLYVITGSGFIVYVSWCVVKWLIPT